MGREVTYTEGSEYVEVRKTLGGVRVKTINQVRGLVGGFAPFRIADTGHPALESARTGAATLFNRRARNAVTSLSGGVVLGELRETLRLIRNPAASIRKAIDDYYYETRRRIKRGRARKKPTKAGMGRVAAETWLETMFGVMPLVNDIQGAAKALAEQFTGALDVTPIGGSASRDVLISDVHTGFVSTGFIRRATRTITKDSYEVVYRGVVVSAVKGHKPGPLNVGLTFQQFIPTVWELIPYSFLVDYFTNIGDILSAYSQGDINFSWKNMSSKSVGTVEQTTINRPAVVDIALKEEVTGENYKSSSCKTSTKHFTRASIPGYIVPSFRWEIPGYSSLKWANIAALAACRTLPKSLMQ
jgi:hypothetical protein